MNDSATRSKAVLVTGATGMLGSATALELASRGADTILAVRDHQRGAALLDTIRRAAPEGEHRLVVGDLANRAAVRGIANQVAEVSPTLRAVIHTAATFTRTRKETVDGHELMFAVNVLARVALTDDLLERLEHAPARVVAAAGPSPDRLDFDDLMARERFSPFMQFRATNAANLMLSFKLARELAERGTVSDAFHPGVLQSELMKEMPAIVRWMTLPFGRSADKAAGALAELAWSGHPDENGGAFFKLGKAVTPPKNARDVAAQDRLWTEAHRLLAA